MQRAQLFDNGEYIVIYVDMNTYLEKEVHKYIYSEFFKLFLLILTSETLFLKCSVKHLVVCEKR